MRTTMMLTTLGLLASGCTRLAPVEGVSLVEPVSVTAIGAQPMSQVSMRRQGVLDPAGHQLTLAVRDARIRLQTDDQRAQVQELELTLEDVDLPPTEAAPVGISLRLQQLSLARVVPADLLTRADDTLAARAHTTLRYHSWMVLGDGTLYPLGVVQTELSDLELQVRREGTQVRVTVDAAPRGTCWVVPGILDVQDCSLYVESLGSVVQR